MLYNYNLIKDLQDFQRNFTNYFDEYEKRNVIRGDYPLINITEDENQFNVTALIPGVDPKEVEITYENQVLTLSGDKKSDLDKEKSYIRQERNFGKFHKSLKVRVPIDPEKISASYKDGILDVVLVKTEAAKPIKIAVK